VDIEGRPHEIVGIMLPGADVMDNRTEVWLPLWVHPNAARNRSSHALHVIARLKDGVTAEAARTELNALLDNWGGRFDATGHLPTNRPSDETDHSLRLQPLREALVGDARPSIVALQAAAGFVLLIACANLANLVLARSESRRREFAVRAALGASRSRLLRQTMTESAMLSGAGGLLGLWLASTGVQALIRHYPSTVPRFSEVAVDVPVLLFALGVSIATGLLFGLAPVAGVRVRGVVTALKDGGDRGAVGGGRHHVRGALVAAEVALAVMLVIGAGLLARTVYNLAAVDAGFDRSHLVTFSMTLPQATSEPETRVQAYQRLLEKLRSEPGVQAATGMSGLPLGRRPPQRIRTRVERDTAPQDALVTVDYYQLVMSDYFTTMGIPIVAGRGFEAADAESSGSVAVVNQTLANMVWQGRNPVGQRLRPDLSAAIGAGANPWTTVIGVAKDVKQNGVDREAGTELYVFAEQQANAVPTMNVVLKATLTPAALSRTLDRLVREVDPAVPVVRLQNMDSVFAESIRRPRLLAQLLGTFAGLALLLAAVGTYGVLSYMVTERRREIGIRMALGAARSSVIALVMKQGLQAAFIGVVAGLAGAVGVNRLIAGFLFGVRPADPATLGAVVMMVAGVAAVACWLPAWRASRLDPNAVLRAD
jgi:putative ABC transport system permease protein